MKGIAEDLSFACIASEKRGPGSEVSRRADTTLGEASTLIMPCLTLANPPEDSLYVV